VANEHGGGFERRVGDHSVTMNGRTYHTLRDATNTTDPSGNNQMLLDFTAKFIDATGAVYTGAPGQVPFSIGIYYTNLAWGSQTDQGYFNYSYSSTL
jgi:hypothetical protein